MATGAIVDVVTGERLAFQYDPDGIAGSDGVNWADQTVPGTSHVGAQFVAGGERSMRLVLQFSAEQADKADVRRKVDWLRALTFPEYRDQELAGPPHSVIVAYGPATDGKLYRATKVDWKLSSRDPSLPEFREAEVTLDLAEVGESTSSDEVRW